MQRANFKILGDKIHMICQKALNEKIVFSMENRAGGIQQNTAGLNETRQIVQDRQLDLRKSGDLLLRFIPDFRAFPDHAKT